jgi:CelD/BcsL family acetyltransferase involved in cellulose biosynthesis
VAETRLIDPIADPEWLAFIEGSPTAEVFHHPRWLGLLRDQYGYQVQACCLANGNGIEAGIPVAKIESRLTGRRLVSLPFSDVCSPALAPGTDSEALDDLGRALAEQARASELGLTVHAPLSGAPKAFVQPRFVRHLLSLDADLTEIEASYAKQIKRGIKKAEREGLRVERRGDRAALDAFYSLHLQTRRRLGVPTQPKSFIRRFEGLFDAGLGFVAVVLDESEPIAAAVFLTHNETATYKYGASDAARLGKRPNNLLFAETIRWARDSGFRTLDFGRTDLDNEGLRAFKRSWGAREESLSYTYLDAGEPSLQPSLRDRVMGATIRRSPALVGRLAGAALYKHFG